MNAIKLPPLKGSGTRDFSGGPNLRDAAPEARVVLWYTVDHRATVEVRVVRLASCEEKGNRPWNTPNAVYGDGAGRGASPRFSSSRWQCHSS